MPTFASGHCTHQPRIIASSALASFSPATVRGAEDALQFFQEYGPYQLEKHLHNTPLDKIGPEDVERFKTTRAGECKTVRGDGKRIKTNKRLRPATVNRELACLKTLFNFVIKADVLAKNPVSRVKMLAENNLQTRVLSFTEQHNYLAKATPVLRDVATMILETGMRPEEVYTLRLRMWIW
jgi:site-specific recombinase XerD